MSNGSDSFNVTDLSGALNDEARAGLVNSLKNKLQNLTEEHADVLENLSSVVRKRVEVLREIQACYLLLCLAVLAP
uniref:Nucleosome assembly protein 13-like n=1 Tax=Rhizophora mucronata TaxID=61149 RepID=A0A2P2M067_RHIMU